MPTMKLTEKTVERLPFSADSIEYYDTKIIGFGVRTGKKSKTYFVKGRADGEQFKRSIGIVGIMEFDDASELAHKAIKDASQGLHPEESKKAAQAIKTKAERGNATLEWFFNDYTATRKTLKQSTKDHYKEGLGYYVPEWLQKPLQDISTEMVVSKHAEIGKKSKSQANHTFKVIRAIFNHANTLYDDLFPKNPVTILSRLSAWYKIPRKKNYLKPSQLKTFYKSLHNHPGVIADYLEVLLLTGCRPNEVASLKSTMLFLKDGLITLDETKTTEDYLIPISSTVVAVLERRVKALEEANSKLKDDEEKSLLLFPSRTGEGHIKDPRKTINIILSGTGISLTPYDMRRTFLTYSDEIGITKFVQKRLVGHAISDDVTDGYIQLTMPRLKRDTEKITQEILLQAAPEPEETSEE